MLNKGQSLLAWAILLACLIAVPVGLWSKSTNQGEQEKSPKDEKRLSFLVNKDRITVMRLSGMIANDEDGSNSLFPDTNSPSYIRKQLYKAAENEHIKAVLIRINSPGGTVAMSQEICNAVKAVRAKDKPVYVSMGDLTASGGYYIASAADRIFASPGTLTGSIGVIMHLLDLSEIEKKLGVQPCVIKSGQFKDIGSMDRAPTKEEQQLLQSIIMDSYDQFVTAVAEGRKMSKEEVKKLADGRIYSGRQALKAKLIDALGGYEETLAELKKVCKEKYNKDLYVDEGRASLGLLNALLESKSNVNSIDVLKRVLPESLNPQFAGQPLWLME